MTLSEVGRSGQSIEPRRNQTVISPALLVDTPEERGRQRKRIHNRSMEIQ